MSVWSQIVADYAEAPKIKKKADEIPDTHKRCSMCQEVKLRDEFYKKPGDSFKSVSPRCKACQSVLNKAKRLEKKK